MAKPGCFPPPQLVDAYGSGANCAYASYAASALNWWASNLNTQVNDVDSGTFDLQRCITRFLYHSHTAVNAFPKLMTFLQTGTNFADMQSMDVASLVDVMNCTAFLAISGDSGVFNLASYAAQLTTAGQPALAGLVLAIPLAEWNRVIMQGASDVPIAPGFDFIGGDCSECE